MCHRLYVSITLNQQVFMLNLSIRLVITIPVKGVPLLILEDTCSQEISKSEQADLSQTSDSSICNSIKLESLDGLLSYLENGNRENCTTYTTCTREARITISNVPRQLHTREFSTKAAVKSMSSYNIVNSLLNDVKMKISETAKRLYADKIISNQPEKSISLESTNNSLALNSDKVLQMGWASKSINPSDIKSTTKAIYCT
ncbi:unnamed protein product [Mytilus edulis]|uniref:Uncharacterized protein n=1 Tax=Mytilus edulis TaxID=6550 RepID=A0A8S3RZD1_MYTED|nr:unnamed protein product [Mytilus edulis]